MAASRPWKLRPECHNGAFVRPRDGARYSSVSRLVALKDATLASFPTTVIPLDSDECLACVWPSKLAAGFHTLSSSTPLYTPFSGDIPSFCILLRELNAAYIDRPLCWIRGLSQYTADAATNADSGSCTTYESSRFFKSTASSAIRQTQEHLVPNKEPNST